LITTWIPDPDVEPGKGRAGIQKSSSRNNQLVELAPQFGEAMGRASGVAPAIGHASHRMIYKNVFEPAHDRGPSWFSGDSMPTSASICDAPRDLMRIARAGARWLVQGDLHQDLADALARRLPSRRRTSF